MKLFVGRLSPEEFLTDTTGYQGPAQPPNEDDEEDWLVGLGYPALLTTVRVDWPQDDPFERRETSWGMALGVQIQFGDIGWDPDEG
jgi:hypothetical protein